MNEKLIGAIAEQISDTYVTLNEVLDNLSEINEALKDINQKLK